GAAGQGAVADVGDGDLDRVLVHRRIVAEDLGADDDVLGEILGHAAADHEQAGGGVLDLELGELVEVPAAVPAGAGAVAAVDHVGDKAEPGGTVGKSRAEDGHVALVTLVHDAVAALRAAVLV